MSFMKKAVFVLCVLFVVILLPGNRLFAFEMEWGLKVGMMHSLSNISRDLPGISWEPIHAFSCGSYLVLFFIENHLGLQPEIHYSIKGFNARETDQGQEIFSKYKISYIEIPLLLSYKLPLRGRVKPGVVIGPYFGFAQKVKEVQTVFGSTEERELGDNLKKADVGLVFGGNIRYHLGRVTVILTARYNLGLVTISKNIQEVAYDFQSYDTIKNRAWSIMLGIGFNLINRKE
jgi:hypothetical protein